MIKLRIKFFRPEIYKEIYAHIHKFKKICTYSDKYTSCLFINNTTYVAILTYINSLKHIVFCSNKQTTDYKLVEMNLTAQFTKDNERNQTNDMLRLITCFNIHLNHKKFMHILIRRYFVKCIYVYY